MQGIAEHCVMFQYGRFHVQDLVLFIHIRFDKGNKVCNQAGKIYIFFLKAEFPAFDAGHIQHFINQPQQML